MYGPPEVDEYAQTLELAAGDSVTVSADPLTPALIFCVVPGAILIAGKFIVKLVPLSVPVTGGPLLITLILYPVPVGVFAGIVALIVPELALLTNVPIFTGLVNELAASDN